MYKFIRNHQKKFLAVFGVLLMVIFIIPTSFKNSRNANDHIVGHLGDQPVYASDAELAAKEWKVVGRYYQMALGPDLSNAIDNKPVLFLLLQKEAEKQLVTVDPKAVFELGGSEQGPEGDERRQAFHSWLLVTGLIQQLAEAVKPTEPAERQVLALEDQKARLSLVTFKADQFKSAIPTPTADQLRKMYDRLSHVAMPTESLAGGPPQAPPAEDNPLGFGYELPRRVKLQYIEIPRSAVIEVIAKTPPSADVLPDYLSNPNDAAGDWELAAKRYRLAHIADYPTTIPGTNAATLPTSQPFAEVEQKILELLQSPAADALENKVRNAIFDKLHDDWNAYAATTQPASRPATGPATRPVLGAPTTGPAANLHYLQKLTLDIQKQFGVLPKVQEVPESESALELGLELGIGRSATTDGDSFADYAIGSDDPAEAGRNLHILEPSTWLNDTENNSFIFRLTAVAPATPAPFESVRSRVMADWVTQQAYDKALAAAKDLADKTRGKILQLTAAAAGMPAFYTGFFQPGVDKISEDLVDKKAQPRVDQEAEKLLGLATPDDPHPTGIVELPMQQSLTGQDPTVIVVQLAGTASALPPGSMWREQLEDYARAQQSAVQSIANQYFSYDAVVARMGYKAVDVE